MELPKLPGLMLLGCVVLTILVPPAAAQFAQRVVESRLKSRIADDSMANVTFIQPGKKLPACPGTKILATGLPDVWGALTAEEQAISPLNILFMQLAQAVYPDDPLAKLGKCLDGLGLNITSFKLINVQVLPYKGIMTAYIASAGARATFVVIKGTDFEETGDVLTDVDCAHTENLGHLFGSDKEIRFHTGFYRGWASLEEDVVAAVEEELKHVSPGVDGTKQVFVVGHSMGAAIGAIGALRLNYLFSSSNSSAQVAGVHLFGCPRTGNEGWQQEYDQKLLSKTLRMSNYADFATQLPMTDQLCPLTHLNTTFPFRHIGRSVVLCPNRKTGLVSWKLYPEGSENLECGTGAEPVFALIPHLLGSYVDSWRRGVAAATGSVDRLASAEPVLSVQCDECSLDFLDIDGTVNVPARAGGPITCATGASCSNPKAWTAAVAIANTQIKDYSPFSFCHSYLCT